MEIAVALVLLITLSILVILLRKPRSRKRAAPANREHEAPLKGSSCPLCGETLPAGHRVHSILFPGRDYDMMHIFGCPRCRPGEEASPPASKPNPRQCPSCRGRVPEAGYVLAQVYRKPGRRPHVHVVGCTACKPLFG